MLAHLTLTVRNLTPTSITSIATPPFPRSMLCVVFYTPKVLHNIDKGDRGCLDMKFCIKWASMYMVIRNEVKVMLFRLSAPRIFDQDCSLICKEGCRFSMGWCMREPYCPLSSAVCNATIPTLSLFGMGESACSPFYYIIFCL